MSTRTTIDVDRHAIDDCHSHRILVTNDDGIESPGLQRLARALARDHDVVVAAPSEDMSGTGTGMGRLYDNRVPATRRDLDGIEAWAIDGPPGLAVMSAALGGFGEVPELVVSGINAGLNTGHSIIHSGTVGAALTALTFGSRGLAVSLAPSDPWQWDTAVPVAVAAADWVLHHRPDHALNVNVPAVAPGEIAGVRWADLDEFGHFGLASTDADATELVLDVRDRTSGVDPTSDTAQCLDGYVTLTALAPVGQATFPDVAADDVVPRRSDATA